jgi:beta-lactamase superfamily II metal-dependent hydrolase
MAHRFVGLPKDARGRREKTWLYAEDREKKVVEVLWGDWLWVEDREPDGWLRVTWGRSGPNPRTLFIPEAHTAAERPLEIVFLDVGQGDGAVLITPERGSDERVIVIDAGAGEHMHAFLSRRFGGYQGERFRFHAAVITHPDSDHYAGFETIFGSPLYSFDVIYHSGLMERPVGGTFEKLGGLEEDQASGRDYLSRLLDDRASIEPVFGAPADIGDFLYPRVIRAALENPSQPRFAMLSTATAVEEAGSRWMPGFAPSDPRPYAIEVLGPVVEFDAGGKKRLRRFDSYGETKNGHSVLLRLHFNGFRVLFGGDLNDKAEKFLLTHYAGAERFPAAGTPAYKDMVAKASANFRAEVMKVCHHGSEKVTDAFLETVFPAAFVLSSGDEEGHVHPRPDLLGRLGRLGRGNAPVLLSTELQRSTREKGDERLSSALMAKLAALEAKPTVEQLKELTDGIAALSGSTVTVDGTIYLKTDGADLLTAFRIETGSQVKKWFTYHYRLKAAADGEGSELELVA